MEWCAPSRHSEGNPVLLWSVAANTLALSNPTNFITSNPSGGTGFPNERTIAYNALSNQLLVVRGPSGAASYPNLRIFVVDADNGTNGAMYVLKTNGITLGQNLTLGGIGVAWGDEAIDVRRRGIAKDLPRARL